MESLLRPLLHALVLLCVVVPEVHAQHGASRAEKWRSVGDLVQAEIRRAGAPGAALAVVHRDRIVFMKGFGVTSVETRAPMTADVAFYLPSVHRLLTAAVVSALEQEGAVDFRAPVGRYVKDLSPKLSRVTLEQLLSETAGLISEHFRGDVRSWTDSYVFTEPGRVFSSSAPSFALAGAVAEQAASTSFDELLESRLFRPVGMARSAPRLTTAVTRPFALGHVRAAAGSSAQIVLRPILRGSDGPFASAHDLGRLMVALLDAANRRQTGAALSVARHAVRRSWSSTGRRARGGGH